VPGAYVARPVYAPALVAWGGSPGVSVTVSIGSPPVRWVPLAPREIYRPYYRTTPIYVDRVNPRPHYGWRHDNDHRNPSIAAPIVREWQRVQPQPQPQPQLGHPPVMQPGSRPPPEREMQRIPERRVQERVRERPPERAPEPPVQRAPERPQQPDRDRNDRPPPRGESGLIGRTVERTTERVREQQPPPPQPRPQPRAEERQQRPEARNEQRQDDKPRHRERGENQR